MSTPTASVPHAHKHARLVAGAQAIFDPLLWCVVEVCVDVLGQKWEPRLLLCEEDAHAAVTTAAEWSRGTVDVDAIHDAPHAKPYDEIIVSTAALAAVALDAARPPQQGPGPGRPGALRRGRRRGPGRHVIERRR